MRISLINLVYLVASVCFILGLKGLASPRSAPRGNLIGALGMLLAVVATLLDQQIITFQLIIIGLVVGGAIGTYLALTVEMTAMPQMVAAFNGFGGGASALVAATALLAPEGLSNVPPTQLYVATAASGLGQIAGSTPLAAQKRFLTEDYQWNLVCGIHGFGSTCSN